MAEGSNVSIPACIISSKLTACFVFSIFVDQNSGVIEVEAMLCELKV
jgi:hypothetical protein